ncbi:hypothetical protein [Pseudomonas khavaziana]|uniref:hypothetical protein n=1 Tax=Pseudomonas khavaziana TaxID=2842351 RepID=UPI001C3D88A6|nr:hypothetical protein [Pseudomonas khavaziana]MBV4482898.1 hypothetical protein [Pseudomonas khavaziana]
MKNDHISNTGLGACEEAIQRLLDGKPIVAGHVGLDLSKLTASIVSLEAGFDRGYLKRSRKSHLPLLAKIEAVRAQASKGTSTNGRQVRQIERQLAVLRKELEIAQIQRDKVLAQNIKLWERVRKLEYSLVISRSGKVEHIGRLQ